MKEEEALYNPSVVPYWKRMNTKLWTQFAYRIISNVEENQDCGLYCMEERFCDFFIPPGGNHDKICYLGTFRRKVQGIHVKLPEYGSDVFPVEKSN